MSRLAVVALALAIGLALIGIGVIVRHRSPTKPAISPASSTEPSTTVTSETIRPTTKRLVAGSISGVADEFRWSAEVPAGWEAEAVPAIEAINLYDPAVSGDSNLEKAQLFIRHFEANSFLTLSTVDILQRDETTVAGRPAVRYEIEKQVGVANFPNQPSWRSQRHTVTDVRVSDANPSVFYVIAKRPDLDQAVYDQFLASFTVGITSGVGTDSPEVEETSKFVPPIAEFADRITKKPFGIHITPATSPVQPERFSGYHTGVDVEYADPTSPSGSDGASPTADVPVFAVVDATVVQASAVSGYGGLLVLKGSIDGQSKFFLYGHVRTSSLPAVGSSVKQGDQVGVLGSPGAETDGERKHLHFTVSTKEPLDIRGYVQSKSELTAWQNPLDLIK